MLRLPRACLFCKWGGAYVSVEQGVALSSMLENEHSKSRILLCISVLAATGFERRMHQTPEAGGPDAAKQTDNIDGIYNKLV